jgi:hypothetical protein
VNNGGLIKSATFQTAVSTLPLTNIAGEAVVPTNLINKFALRVSVISNNLAGTDMLVAFGPAEWFGALHGTAAVIRTDNSISASNKRKEFGDMWIPHIPGTTPNWIAYRYSSSPTVDVRIFAASFRV